RNANMPPIERARAVVSSVRRGLTYSNNEQLSQLYRSDPARFFTQIWEHKEADCDVANTLASEVLHQAGLHVRMVGGHSISSQTKEGSAVLHDGTRHAWLEVWDPVALHWVRLDATPAGDPNVDEEQQEEDLNPRPEGDYGERDAEILTDEDLDALRKKMEETTKQQEKPSIDDPIAQRAKEARCTIEEMRRTEAKILDLRRRHRSVLDACRDSWRAAIKKNLVPLQEYTGPVPPQMGDEIDEENIVEIPLAIAAHDPAPLAFKRREDTTEVERSFGGYEVYLAADMSDSMNETDPSSNRQKKDLQRDAVFLFVDSMMQNVFQVQRA
ncbi:transglutaminase domain-containing protein, partial [Candidatus Peregrinibacteria bacterium]|nr:transglutaminase domain-containing protein [Candidatus Peregrinibacteria bacterium]